MGSHRRPENREKHQRQTKGEASEKYTLSTLCSQTSSHQSCEKIDFFNVRSVVLGLVSPNKLIEYFADELARLPCINCLVMTRSQSCGFSSAVLHTLQS